MTDAAARAEHAKRLLDDPILGEAFAEIRAELLHDWENTPDNATERREGTWRTLKAIDRLQGKLRSIVDNGKIAAARAQR